MRACNSRWIWAGFNGLFSRVSFVLTFFRTVPVSARTRWYGVAG